MVNAANMADRLSPARNTASIVLPPAVPERTLLMNVEKTLRDKLQNISDGTYRESSIFFRTDLSAGGTIVMYPLFPGIVLSRIQIDPQNLRMPKQPKHALVKNRVIKLNWCRSGRCEMITENNNFIYLKSNEISFSTEQTKSRFQYPSKTYTGIEFFLSINEIDRHREIFDLLDISFSSLNHRFLSGRDTLISAVPLKIEHTLNDLYQSMEQEKEFLLPRLRTLTLGLFFLLTHDVLLKEPAAHPHLMKEKIEIAHAAEHILTRDLSQPVPIAEAAAKLGISPTTLKRLFYNVYQTHISVYIKKRRMAKAAELLSSTSSSVSSIAAAVGYSSVGHFSKTFKESFGMSPLNYRRFG